MKIKSKDIAKELGVSPATVSMALNNRPGVSEETRRKVLQHMAELKGDAAEEPAGVIRMFAFVEEREYWDAAEEVRIYQSYLEGNTAARELGYRLDFIQVHEHKDDFRGLLSETEQEGAVGIYLNAAYMKDEDLECFKKVKIPYIVTDQSFEDGSADSIVLNNRQGVRQGLNYLWENGHRRILYFRNSHNFYNMYERRAAYQEFMTTKNQQEDCQIVDIGGSTQESYTNMLDYIKRGETIPTAIFSENYEVTIGVCNALLSSGIRIPEDVSIVGFDELPSTAILNFQPASIRALHARKAHVAITRLVERIEGKAEETIQILVNTELIPGNSVRRIN